MNVTEKPSLAPHRCKVCGHAPPVTVGQEDRKAPYLCLETEDDSFYRNEIYLCAGCVKTAATKVLPRLGITLITVEEKTRLETQVHELEVQKAILQAECDKQRDLLLSLVDLPALIGVTGAGEE